MIIIRVIVLFQSACAQEKSHTRTSHETPMEKQARVDEATSRKVRRLSGWNVFQREQLQDQSLTPGAYSHSVRGVSKRWADLSDTDKDAYRVQAAHENQLREKLSATPLASKFDKKDSAKGIRELEEQVGRSGCKKLSARRLVVNEDNFKNHSVWSCPTQLGDSSLALSVLFIVAGCDTNRHMVTYVWTDNKICNVTRDVT